MSLDQSCFEFSYAHLNDLTTHHAMYTIGITWKINLIQALYLYLIDPLISRNTRLDSIIISGDHILYSPYKLIFFLFVLCHSDSLENRQFSESIVTRFTASMIIYNDIIWMYVVCVHTCMCIYVLTNFKHTVTIINHVQAIVSDKRYDVTRQSEPIAEVAWKTQRIISPPEFHVRQRIFV